MSNGYWQKLLRINLSTSNIAVEDIPLKKLQHFIGGAGLGGEILRQEVGAKIAALGPENKVVFATGPFQGNPIPGSAKFSMTAISPLTNTFADTAAGADFGIALKKAGYDVLIVEGKAAKPVFLHIIDQDVSIKDAAAYWGQDAYATVDAITKDYGKLSIASIGQAGENQVAIACVVVDKHSFAGRCGLGAVMGSKNLKAVAVQGTQNVAVAQPEKVRSLLKEYQKIIATTVKENGFREHGTPGLCESAEALGDMPIKYWAGDVWPEGAKTLGAPYSTEVLKARPYPCKFCPVGCHRQIEVTEPAEYAVTGAGPEYETYGLMGSNLLIGDPKVVAKGNDLANRLGLDTISAGAMVGFCMEAQEKGWITPEQTGIDFSFGKASALLEMLPLIAHKQGFGAIFAQGTLMAAKQIHPQAAEIVVHVKGLDLPAHDPRACISLIPTYATGTRGACHFRGGSEDIEMGGFFIPEVGITEGMVKFFETPNQSLIAATSQDYFSLLNSLVLCAFMVDGGGLSFTHVQELFNAVTGWDYSITDLMQAGERGFISQRLINIRDGYDVHSDTLPAKMFIPAKEGFRANQPFPQTELLQDYYQIRQWNAQGHPSLDTLKRLELQ